MVSGPSCPLAGSAQLPEKLDASVAMYQPFDSWISVIRHC